MFILFTPEYVKTGKLRSKINVHEKRLCLLRGKNTENLNLDRRVDSYLDDYNYDNDSNHELLLWNG